MFRTIILLSAVAILSACSATVTVPYNPVGTAEVVGKIKVENFAYQPPVGMKANQLPNTAAGYIYLTEPVGEWVSNAIRKELRLAGISSRGETVCTLGGSVNKLLMDDLGWSVDYESNIDYELRDPDESVLLTKNYVVAFEGSKFVETAVFASISKMVSDGIGQLLIDPEFITIVERDCRA